MSIEIIRQERTGEKRFNAEFLKAIKALMRLDVEPNAENIFSWLKCHPADCPYISQIITLGKEDLLRVYLHLYGRTRDRIRQTIPAKKIQEATE